MSPVALVTGGSRGIGAAIARRLAQDGYDVAVGYLMNDARAAAVADEVRALGRQAITVGGDIRHTSEIERIVEETVGTLGRLDVVVANAALGVLKPALEIRDSKWDLTLETCTRSLLAMSRAAAPHLREAGGGSIVTLSSLGARRYLPGYVAIGTAKAALETLVRYLAVELAGDGVRVNCVSGGPIVTDALDYVMADERAREKVARNTPLGRLGEPDDLAKVVSFLCGPDAAWITGQTLVADGGLSLH